MAFIKGDRGNAMINEELRELAVAEYMADYKKMISRNNRKVLILSLGILTVILAAVTVFIPSYKYILEGRYEDGVIEFSIGLIVIILLMVPPALIIWFVYRSNLKHAAKVYENKLRHTIWHISDGCLVNENENDEKAKETYRLEDITNLGKEDHIITFEHKGDEISILDFYDPPLYDTLKDLIKS